jgi:hypothetical protein
MREIDDIVAATIMLSILSFARVLVGEPSSASPEHAPGARIGGGAPGRRRLRSCAPRRGMLLAEGRPYRRTP